MRIVYGVVGEGMGHATRSRVVIEHLLGRGHEVRVVVSERRQPTSCATSRCGGRSARRSASPGSASSSIRQAVHLRVPMYSVPIEGQYEQELNARWLA